MLKFASLKYFINLLRLYLWNHWFAFVPFYIFRHGVFRRVLGATLGKQSSLLIGVQLKCPKRISIGNNCVINSNVLLDGRGGLVIGNNVDIAREVIIWTLTHNPQSAEHAAIEGEVIIEDNVWIGARSQLLAGVRVGNNSIVGAGSMVTKDIPPNVIVAGVPARVIGHRPENPNYKLNHSPWFE